MCSHDDTFTENHIGRVDYFLSGPTVARRPCREPELSCRPSIGLCKGLQEAAHPPRRPPVEPRRKAIYHYVSGMLEMV